LSQSARKKEYEIAIIGQPNVGKSTLFNILTGRRAHVANWPGVTVEVHEGETEFDGYRIKLVDLPGIYGFSTLSLEERIARNYILSGRPDAVIVLVDSLNPERTMYLAIQALEMTGKIVIGFTKSDAAHAHGIHINYDLISKRLGVPVVPVSAATLRGVRSLLRAALDVARGKAGRKKPLRIDYGELEPHVSSIESILREFEERLEYPIRWMALRLLEGDDDLYKYVKGVCGETVAEEIQRIREEVRKIFHRDPAELLARKRFEYLRKILGDAIVRLEIKKGRFEGFTKLFYRPFIGPVLSIAILLGMFMIAFTINTGFPLNILLDSLGMHGAASAVEEYSIGGLMEKLFSWISNWIINTFGESWLTDLIANGIISGVGSVLIFLPLIMIVSLFLAILEDSGIAPRMAVSLHGPLSKIGVSGHAIFPMTMSLGCNVPAILATRAIPSRSERLRLMITLPFIPCQARLVVILAFASSLISGYGALLVVLGYVVAFLAFALVNKVLYMLEKRKTGRKEPELVLELPPIHRPLGRVIWWHVWDSSKHFLKKAGTIIFALSIILWFMINVSPSLTLTDNPAESIAAGFAHFLSPIVYPIGISPDKAWIVAFALLVGFIAKEAVIETLTILTGTASAQQALFLLGLTVPQLASLTVFIVLYVPCIATLAVIYSESRSIKHTLATIALMLGIAYIAMLITYGLSLIL